MLKKITFEDKVFEYDPKEAKNYKNIKRIVKAKSDPEGLFDVFEAIFAGKDEEYAEVLDNDLDKLSELMSAAINNEGAAGKN